MRDSKASGIVFGIALAGFWDGIILHSILQWHHMISSKVSPTAMHGMQINMVADGLFDLFCWVVTIAGIVLLFGEGKRQQLPSGRRYFGWILIGAGIFNLVEGVIDHEILGVHHVHPGPNWLAWDLGFLAIFGLFFIAVGWVVSREPRSIEPKQSLHAA